MGKFDTAGKRIIVAGGSKGLGQELALQLVGRGAHVTVLARGQAALDETQQLLESRVVHKGQQITTASLDLLDVEKVTSYVSGLAKSELPSVVFCVAGGTEHELGFFADVSAHALRACMDKNYLSSVYLAQAIWKRWTSATGLTAAQQPTERHLVFTASTAALIALPGYDAYAPTKAAIRSLADILRQEALLYWPTTHIHVHCSFPGTIYTDTFYREQQNKPQLLKEMEGSDGDLGGAGGEDIARGILRGLDRGRFFVTTDFNTQLLLNNMRGSSPRDLPILDWILGFVMSFVWPLFRVHFDSMVRREGVKKSAIQLGKL